MGRILIAGGGLNGTALALALRQGGLEPVLIDPVPAPDRGAPFDGRSYALAHASVRMLRALGVWGAVDAHAQPILTIRVADGLPGRGVRGPVLTFDHAEIEEGPMGWMAEDRHLRPALTDAAEGIETHASPVAAQAEGPAGIAVTLQDGTTLEGAVLVGADGRRSGVARRAGIAHAVTEYDQWSLTCALTVERDHGGTAWQVFYPEGPLAILPLTERRVGVVWTRGAAEARRVQALPDEGYLDALRPLFGSFLGQIALTGARGAFPLERSVARQLTRGRVALIGDAAHAVHPVAGQGLNAGLKDAATLAEALSDARRRGQDPAEGLPAHARWRRFDTAALATATDGFARLFSNDDAVLGPARRAGLGLVGRVPALRRAFIREAAGLTGDLPRLLRGRPL
ncbi:MAG: FAD-dependent monooxygenase [Hasllibacter sp.]